MRTNNPEHHKQQKQQLSLRHPLIKNMTTSALLDTWEVQNCLKPDWAKNH
ncbi:MAG: hypothetical protein JW709_05840 [Sedimentisphaerales bacterium]|nr:hypothetical protein [Sedimentisphaerales bacterium]